MPASTKPAVSALAASEDSGLVEVVLGFVESLSDVIDRMQSHSCGYLDQALLAELRDTIEDQAWGALVAYQACCWLEADLEVVARAARARRVQGA